VRANELVEERQILGSKKELLPYQCMHPCEPKLGVMTFKNLNVFCTKLSPLSPKLKLCFILKHQIDRRNDKVFCL